MSNQTSTEKLPKTTEEKIAAKDKKIQQLLNQKKKLKQKHAADERKARTHRFCKRHGMLEKDMPDLAKISDEHFAEFIRRGINTKYGKQILAELVVKAEEAAAALSPTPTTDEDSNTTSNNDNPRHDNTADGGATPPDAEQAGA